MYVNEKIRVLIFVIWEIIVFPKGIIYNIIKDKGCFLVFPVHFFWGI